MLLGKFPFRQKGPPAHFVNCSIDRDGPKLCDKKMIRTRAFITYLTRGICFVAVLPAPEFGLKTYHSGIAREKNTNRGTQTTRQLPK